MKEFSNIVLGTAILEINIYQLISVNIDEALLIISNFINNGGFEIDVH